MTATTVTVDPTIRTRSGIDISLLAPDPAMIRIGDIAWSLSNINRFTGHAPWQSTDIAHVLRTAELVIELGHPELALEALHHDSTEAYCGDQAGPLKAASRQLLGGARTPFDEIERRFENAIAAAFRLHWTVESHAIVKRADVAAYAEERARWDAITAGRRRAPALDLLAGWRRHRDRQRFLAWHSQLLAERLQELAWT